MLKIAVFAPIPMANDSSAVAVKAGAAIKARRACRRSFRKMLMQAISPQTTNVSQLTIKARRNP
jgi:hypothetical protein